jgi:hypothetical protein
MKNFLVLAMAIVSLNVSADIVNPLPSKDPLGRVARAVATQLADSNISSGTTSLWAGTAKLSDWFEDEDDQEFAAYVRKGFLEAFNDDREEKFPKGIELVIEVGNFIDGDGKNGTVRKMVAAIIESNDYNPKNQEIWNTQARPVWAVLRKLPVTNETYVGHVKVRQEDKSSGKMRTIQYFLILNRDKKAVQLFTIEGSMG